MPLPIRRLRLWFLAAAILMVAMVAGFYWYAKWQIRERIRKPFEKIGLNIQQSAEGFAISKSEGGRTLYTLKAGKVVQLKLSGRATLEDVHIIVYGKDSTRYDQISGQRFEYDKESGDVTAVGMVDIDLQGNAEGALAADQALPVQLKSPIHLKTNGMVFNQKSGDGYTHGQIEFQIPQASGSAVGARYDAKARTLTLESQVVLDGNSGTGGQVKPAKMQATRAVITAEHHQIALDSATIVTAAQTVRAQHADIYLRDDNSVDRIEGSGGVEAISRRAASGLAAKPAANVGAEVASGSLRAQRALFRFAGNSARRGQLETADFYTDVQARAEGKQPAEASADHLQVMFATMPAPIKHAGGARMGATRARADGHVRLVELPVTAMTSVASNSASAASPKQRTEVTAQAMDFIFQNGHVLHQAETEGTGQITLDEMPGANQAIRRTVITAAKFVGVFTSQGKLASVHGAPDTKIVSSGAGQPDRISTSQSLDVTFRPSGGMDSIIQQGQLQFQDGQRQAWAARGRYAPTDQILTLTGDSSTTARVVEGGLTTTADQIRFSRKSGEVWADGHVKSTYNDLKPQPQSGGALLASGEPIHATAQTMHAGQGTGTAEYRGAARLWQGGNVVEAPILRFTRESKRMDAESVGSQRVTMVVLQKSRNGTPQLVSISADRLTYSEAERNAHMEGKVTAKSADGSLTADRADVLLKPRAGSAPGSSQIQQMTAVGAVSLQQPGRRATGEKLVYQPEEGKYVLTGGPPSIFDAERGQVTGVSLTFFDRSDRVLVEGTDTAPSVTHTKAGR